MPGWGSRGTLATLGLLALAACEPVAAPPPDVASPPPPAAVPPLTSESEALVAYYTRLEQDLLTRGLLRTDGGGPDTPFTDAMLARNFVRIALFDEYRDDGTVLRSQQTLSRLRRWDSPVRFAVDFGPTVPLAQRAADTDRVTAYVNRLARVTGHPMTVTGGGSANFHVLILNEGDRRGYESALRALVPGIADSSVRAFLNLDRTTHCLVIAFAGGGSSSYSKAVALIRGEHPDLLRLSCIHEELAQGLGLANDSPAARPSIFNDDEEFGLLTTHDEMLLRILYDARLRAGMTAAEAAPIARQIARELLASGS